jgi:hypothetical protein
VSPDTASIKVTYREEGTAKDAKHAKNAALGECNSSVFVFAYFVYFAVVHYCGSARCGRVCKISRRHAMAKLKKKVSWDFVVALPGEGDVAGMQELLDQYPEHREELLRGGAISRRVAPV